MKNRPDLQPYAAAEHQPYSWQGSGNVALLVHGFPGTPAELRRAGTILHSAGWSVHGMLLPGFGTQFPEISTKSHRDWLHAVLDTLALLRREYDRVLLLGNSMGAALALQAAAQAHVEGVVLFAPWWRINNRLLDTISPLAAKAIRTLRPFRKADFSDPRMAEAIQRVLPAANLQDPDVQHLLRSLSLPTRVLVEVRTAGQLGYAAAPHVTAPTLIFQGCHDPLAHPTLTEVIARRLPNLAGAVVVASGHELAHLREDAEAHIAPLLARFAASIAATSTAATSTAAPHPSRFSIRQQPDLQLQPQALPTPATDATDQVKRNR